jgi:D-alanyl-lipoteichoic acid acyltransferase DltB (MBOAT superfamily)
VLIDGLNNRPTDASLLEILVYVLFFPALLVGPIDRLPRFLKDLRKTDRQFSWTFIVVGLTRIAIGVLKKFVVADILLAPLALGVISPLPYNATNAWTQVLAYSLYILFDFSGYIDIAIGIGIMLGFTLPENFDSPYSKINITRFWQAWHITLSNWLRTYIFFPLSGRMMRTKLRKHPNVIIFVAQMTTMVSVGLWHGITMNFFLWGVWHGVGLFLHKLYSDQTKPYLPRLAAYPVLHSAYTFAGWAVTFIFVSLGWVFFALPNLAASEQVFRTLFGRP